MNYTENILIMGCGGGYDIFTGLPIYFSLNASIYLANFSFTKLDLLSKHVPLSEYVYRIDPHYPVDPNIYFPEQLLANKLGVPIIAFAYEKGVLSLEKGYKDIINTYNIKTIILADGGCDSILFGNESELATPVEDMMNVYVVNKLLKEQIISQAYLSILGITADYFEGVKASDVEANINYLINAGALIYKQQLHHACTISNKYMATFLDCQPSKSIVNCSIVEAINENYGTITSKYLSNRLGSTQIEVSELTSTNYIFKLVTVADSIKYLNLLKDIDDSDEIDKIIMEWHNMQKIDK